MPIDITAVIVALISSVVGALSYLNARKTSREAHAEAQKKIDAEAYERAQAIYDRALKRVEEDNISLVKQLAQTRRELADTQQQLVEVTKRADKESTNRRFLEVQMHELRLEVGRLRQALARAGVHTEDQEIEGAGDS